MHACHATQIAWPDLGETRSIQFAFHRLAWFWSWLYSHCIEMEGDVQIFLAKKEEDQIRAKRIRDIIRPYLGENNDIVMSQDIPKGTKWRDWIKEKLKESDLLLFLFSGPARNWNWCLYEIGLITPLTDRPMPPIVCIHPQEETPPDPIDDLQAVPCTVEALQDFLESFFEGALTDGKAINSNVASDRNLLREIALKIHDEWALHGESENRLYYTRHITVTMRTESDDPPVLNDDAVIDGDRLSLEIFNIVRKSERKPWTWATIKPFFVKASEEAGGNPVRFLKSFEESVNRACNDEMISPSEHCIASLSSGKRYQPVIHRRDSYYNGIYRIRVLFIQTPDAEAGPRNLTFPAPPGE